jgi:hypothetical protein
MTKVVFEREGTVAEYAEERISAAALSGLCHPDVFCQLGDEVSVRFVDNKFAFGLTADEAVGEDDLTLGNVCLTTGRGFGAHDLLPVNLSKNNKND